MPKLITSSRHCLRHLFIAASALTLMACATATPYQPASEPGGFDGFSQQMIENNRARITFGGNSLTKRDTVENYLLYRSAEMAVERGFETFTLQERDLEKNQRVRVTPTTPSMIPSLMMSMFRKLQNIAPQPKLFSETARV